MLNYDNELVDHLLAGKVTISQFIQITGKMSLSRCMSTRQAGSMYLTALGRPGGALSNTAVLCFVLGWQGGTVHQVAKELNVSVAEIIDADDYQMGKLCREAQRIVRLK